MAKETVEMKATRLLLERKVTVTYAQNGSIVAAVQGSEKEPYRVTCLEAAGFEWTCYCPSTVRCSHILAVMMVAGLKHEGDYPPCRGGTVMDMPGF